MYMLRHHLGSEVVVLSCRGDTVQEEEEWETGGQYRGHLCSSGPIDPVMSPFLPTIYI